ncbi:hypothetical protein THAOC_37768, partial [Thalassiosira oceanica]
MSVLSFDTHGQWQSTALSSCEAEIVATNECVEELLSVRYRAADLDLLEEVSGPTAVYNDNQACVNWSASLTTKGIKHLNLNENMIREVVQDGLATIHHIPGVINSSDIFTKEIKCGAHFRRLRDSMMVSRANFLKILKYDHNAVAEHHEH